MLKKLLPGKKKEETAIQHHNRFYDFDKNMNQVVEKFFGNFGVDPFEDFLTDNIKIHSPNFDVAETDSSIEVVAELPGMDEKDVNVTLDGNVLTISGEKKEEHEEKKKDYYIAERKFGSFTRSFAVPDSVEEKNIKAKFAKGVLKVSIPKSEKAKAKHIEINS